MGRMKVRVSGAWVGVVVGTLGVLVGLAIAAVAPPGSPTPVEDTTAPVPPTPAEDTTAAQFLNANDKLFAAVAGFIGTAGILAGLSHNVVISAILSVFFYAIGVEVLNVLCNQLPDPGRSGFDLIILRLSLTFSKWVLIVVGFLLYLPLYRTLLPPILPAVVIFWLRFKWLQRRIRHDTNHEFTKRPKWGFIPYEWWFVSTTMLLWLACWGLLAHFGGPTLTKWADAIVGWEK